MKRFIVPFLMLMLVFAVSLAQPDAPSAEEATEFFPYILLIPYFVGIFLHWFKKYALEGTGVGLFQWFISSFPWTVGSILGGFAAIYALYVMNPAAYNPSNPASWFQVITVAWSFDTINSAGSLKKKNGTPTNGG